MEKKYYSAKEVSAFYNNIISAETIRRYARTRKIPFYQQSSHSKMLFDIDEITKCIKLNAADTNSCKKLLNNKIDFNIAK